MKTIRTGGITYIEPLPGTSGEWYYGLGYEQGDLYEAEELFRAGQAVSGRGLCLVHYPDGRVFHPVPKTEGHYSEAPVFLEGGIFIIDADFIEKMIRILRFDCKDYGTRTYAELPLSSIKDCYNLKLQVSPLTLSRQCVGSNEFEIVWPEKIRFAMDDHDSFFLRDNEKLFFSRWHEEGEGPDYRYWEEIIIRNLAGDVIGTLPGDVMLMPDGEIWHLM